MPSARRVAVPCALLLAAVAGPAATRGGSPEAWAAPSTPAEWRYVDEKDGAAAARLLAPLLEKYDTPKKCEDLLKLLRGKRPRPSGLPDQATLEHECLDGKKRQFTYVLPKKFNPSKPTGVLVFLHGAIRQPAPGGGAGEARLFGPAVEALNLIVVGPSTYDGVEWGDPACRELIHHALDHVKRSFFVDENRVYLAGDSDGARGAFATAETAATFFASAAPIIGSPGGVTRFANLRNLPWFAINGGKDSIFDADRVREAVDGMKAAGIDVAWTLLPEAGHDPYLFLKRKEEICDFFAKHPRDPFPKTVHLEVDPEKTGYEAGFPANTMRWVRVEALGSTEHDASFDDGAGLSGSFARVRARRDGNRIDLETRGVKRLVVLASDAMLDLSKPVEVRANGRLSFRGAVPNDARAILEEARLFKDRTAVFHARIPVDVEAAEAGVAPGDPPGPATPETPDGD
jgi:hypothetical protein